MSTTTKKNTTTKARCGAATKTGAQCKNTCVAERQLCALHLGAGAEVQFASQVVKTCAAQTKANKPCSKPAKEGSDLCGTHSRDPAKPRKESTRKGKLTACNLFTRAYWAQCKAAGETGSAQACAALWKEAKATNSEAYQACVANAD